MDLLKSITRFYKKLNRTRIWTKSLLFFSILLVIVLVTKTKTNIEGFQQSKDFILKTNENLYDDFYCQIYDEILYDKNKHSFEMGEITKLYKCHSGPKSPQVICNYLNHHNYTFVV